MTRLIRAVAKGVWPSRWKHLEELKEIVIVLGGCDALEEIFPAIKGHNPLTPTEDFRALYNWRILEKRAICTLRVGERESQEKDGFFFASSVVDETRGMVLLAMESWSFIIFVGRSRE